jgi:hypothetical protein
MRGRWIAPFAAAAGLALSAQVASAAVPSGVLKKFKAAEAAFAPADAKWSAAIEKLPQHPTPAQIEKPDEAFIPALKTFDAALGKVGFTGAAAAAAATVVKLNTELIAVLYPVKSTASFIASFQKIDAQFLPAQTALGKALGVPGGELEL